MTLESKLSVSSMRVSYEQDVLLEEQLPRIPYLLFQEWLSDAVKHELLEPNAMVLSTLDSNGVISSRTVLLKGYDERGFHFYTNYQSQKSRDIQNHPQVSLLFLWKERERQVIISGNALELPEKEAIDYFAQRPRASQLGAHASPQSEVVVDRKFLEQRYAQIENDFKDQDVPKPAHWGGWCVSPIKIEFWQGRKSRLHDRLIYKLEGLNWKVERLAP
jgi:pyridoxamine 5'-phosphate oxidase